MTTPVLCCGLECGVFGGGHWNVGSNTAFNTSIVRSGTRSIRINPTADIGNTTGTSIVTSNPVVWRFYIRFASFPTTDCMLSYEGIGGGGNCGVAFKNSDSSIYAGNNLATPAFGSSGVIVSIGIWYRIDVKVDPTANPRLTDVQVNGVACGQNSLSLAAGNLAHVCFGSGGGVNRTYDIYIDDFIRSNTGGDYPIGDG